MKREDVKKLDEMKKTAQLEAKIKAMREASAQTESAPTPYCEAAGEYTPLPEPKYSRIAADLGTTPIQVCTALAQLGFGGHSVNMAVRPHMAQSLRAHFASPTPQADSQPAPQGEPWYGHHFKEVRRGYWQCSCGKVISEAASTASKSCYPSLPRRHTYDDDGEELFTADQMRAYVDADRAMLAQAAPQQQNKS